MIRAIATAILTLALLGALFWALRLGGAPFIAGCFTGFAIFELNYWAANDHFYFFSRRSVDQGSVVDRAKPVRQARR